MILLLLQEVPTRAERVANTTLTLPLRPKSESYQLRPAFPAFPPIFATGAATAPGDSNRLFLLAQTGTLYVVTNLASPNLSLFLDLTSRTTASSESGLLGLAFHPGWRTNRQFYVFYSTTTTHAGQSGLFQRVSRFLLDPVDDHRALPDSEQPLISQLDPDPAHNAGDLEFGPDGYLYVSLGDGGGAFDTYQNSQHIQKDFFSGILRLDVDRRPENLEPNPHPAVHPGTYRVPADNPLLGLTTFFRQSIDPLKLRSEFFSVGLRNPYRISFDPRTGELWANDVGQNRREEINRIEAGGNYGWIIYEGSIPWPYQVLDEPYKAPIYEYEHEQGRNAITGGVWYYGTKYPDLTGSYIFADLGGPVGALTLDDQETASVRWIGSSPGITDVWVDPSSGDLLFTTIYDGVVRRLVREEQEGPPIPPLLSQTGIFANLTTLEPNPGIEPYELNVPFWSDHALKQRWFCLPDPDQTFGFSELGSWTTPEGSVWIKHFELEMVIGAASSRRRIETRVLVRSGEGLWGATYRWNQAQTDAELVPPAGLDEDLMVEDQSLIRRQKWRYPGRDECLICHHAAAGRILGFNTAQLNRTILEKEPVHQLEALIANGYFSNPPPSVEPLPALAAADDPRWSLDYRVHSYLSANCAYCHQPDGPTRATWDGRIGIPLNEAGLVGQRALNNLEDIYAMKPTYLVAPGDLQTSSVYRRVADLAPYHMPPLATTERDQQAIQLLTQWIQELPKRAFTYDAWTNDQVQLRPTLDLHPAADPDGDGLSNELEFLLGEDPGDPNRRWRPELVGTPGNWKLKYVRKANVRFQVQWSSRLADGWQAVDSPDNRWFVGTEDETVELPLPANSETSFYRIILAGP